MRPLLLTVLILFASLTKVSAHALPTPPTTYPETGTFCGLLTLCPKDRPPNQEE